MTMISPAPIVAQTLAILQDPADLTAWYALADMLEEDGQDDRAALLRHTTAMRCLADPLTPEHDQHQRAAQSLLARGAHPCWPQAEGLYGIWYSLIPAGAYLMGDDHRPVAITRPFLLATTPITQSQWRAVMGDERQPHFLDHPGAPNLPMESVSWHDAQAFCAKLTTATGATHRLPTEAEWEYACRAGTTTVYHQGDDEADLKLVGHYQASAPRPVGELLPNAWGLHDMHGNVWEWCQDGYHSNSLEGQEVVEVGEGGWKLIRGGAWYSSCHGTGSSNREADGPGRLSHNVGFRVAVDPSRSMLEGVASLRGGSWANKDDVIDLASREYSNMVDRYIGLRVVVDPVQEEGERRTVKGGSWLNDRWRLMVADYAECKPEDHCHHLGFRPAAAI